MEQHAQPRGENWSSQDQEYQIDELMQNLPSGKSLYQSEAALDGRVVVTPGSPPTTGWLEEATVNIVGSVWTDISGECFQRLCRRRCRFGIQEKAPLCWRERQLPLFGQRSHLRRGQ